MVEPSQPILVLDDEADVRDALGQWLDVAGLAPELLSDAGAALARLTPDFPGILISDVKMPGMDGVHLLDRVLTQDPDLPVILISGHGDIPMAVAAMRRGAYDFIEKPFAPERLLETVKRALEKRALVLENRALRRSGSASGMDGSGADRSHARDGAAAQPDRRFSRHLRQCSYSGGNRGGQRVGGALPARFQPPRQTALCSAQLRGYSRNHGGKRAFRP
jgi:CheY-like chemotaxis protein